MYDVLLDDENQNFLSIIVNWILIDSIVDR